MNILNVQPVFLNTDVEEDVFVKMAPSYETNDKARVRLVMKLNKIWYGLRQSPNNWFGTMGVELAGIGFRSLKLDPCVYVYEDETDFVVLALYVEDILFISSGMSLLNKLKKQLMNRFEMSDVGDVSTSPGMNVTRDHKKGAITTSQKDYTEDVVLRYVTKSCNTP